ncbi:MAG TPA: hypothetical protein VHT96_01445 [Clostridia bacterium]|nr:hypothetical protein [Clostridia bacterium]
MRYTNARKYPITQKKKITESDGPNRIIDLSIGAAAGLLGIIFLEGIFCGYMIRGRHK